MRVTLESIFLQARVDTRVTVSPSSCRHHMPILHLLGNIISRKKICCPDAEELMCLIMVCHLSSALTFSDLLPSDIHTKPTQIAPYLG